MADKAPMRSQKQRAVQCDTSRVYGAVRPITVSRQARFSPGELALRQFTAVAGAAAAP